MLRRLGAEVSFHEIAPLQTVGLPVVENFTTAMWFRILLPELLPGVARVLYLDVDVVVLGDVAPLWEIDLTGRSLAAVTNVLLPEHRHRPRELGIKTQNSYFNSGVLLLNLEQMRSDGSASAMRDLAIGEADRLAWPDQDTLNLVLGAGRAALAPQWNVMNSLWLPEADEFFSPNELDDARHHPVIRHFEGPGDNKPWHAGCRHPHAGAYLTHRRRTPWPWSRRTGTVGDRASAILRRVRNAVYLSA